jgi:hypothetical protein
MYPREPQKLMRDITTAGNNPRFFCAKNPGHTLGHTNPGKKLP